MKTKTVRGITLGEGRPKIAVSITGKTQADVLHQAQSLRALGADIAEWRIDHFTSFRSEAALTRCLAALRQTLGEMPLLATFRTKQEGGAESITPEDYQALNTLVAQSDAVDLLDIEAMLDEATVNKLVQIAHENQILALLSNHDFEKTPHAEEMVCRLRHMQAQGGDLLKLAVMPHSHTDVLALLEATCTIQDDPAAPPLITMSMGNLGVLTRLCGAFSGSVLTFGAAEQASAPGQIPAAKLRQILDLLPL